MQDVSEIQTKLEAAMKRASKGDLSALVEVNRLSGSLVRKTPGATEAIRKRRAQIEAARMKIVKQLQPITKALQEAIEKVPGELMDEFLRKATSGEAKTLTCLTEVFSSAGFEVKIMVKRVGDVG